MYRQVRIESVSGNSGADSSSIVDKIVGPTNPGTKGRLVGTPLHIHCKIEISIPIERCHTS